jgi:hypothetical protein
MAEPSKSSQRRRDLTDAGAPEAPAAAGAPKEVQRTQASAAAAAGNDPRVGAALTEGTADVPAMDTRAASSLPTGEGQVRSDLGSQTAFIGAAGVPASGPSTAPAGSAWTDEAEILPRGEVRVVVEGMPQLAYVLTWAKGDVHVDVDKAQTREVGEGDDKHEEKFVQVVSATGSRDAVLRGEQALLYRGEMLPLEAADGIGPFLVSIGAAVAVSVPAQ